MNMKKVKTFKNISCSRDGSHLVVSLKFDDGNDATISMQVIDGRFVVGGNLFIRNDDRSIREIL